MNASNTMTTERKTTIAKDCAQYVHKVGGLNKAANKLQGISSAYLSHIINGKWEKISDEAFRNLENQVGGNTGDNWRLAETTNYKRLTAYYADAQAHSQVYGIVVDAGASKTYTATDYADKHDNVILLKCAEFWNQRQFLKQILKSMGKSTDGYTASDLMDSVIANLQRMERPIIIIDEADKLKDQVLYFFISLYNELEGKCAIVMQATHFLRIRIKNGVERQKKGYREILSRVGGKFIELKDPNQKDVRMVCEANGVHDSLEITRIWNESMGDLRRVKRLVHAYRQKIAHENGEEVNYA